jgi:hypothetical protein
LIGHFDIETQFRILGTCVPDQPADRHRRDLHAGTGHGRGTTYLSVASHIASADPADSQGALAAMQGQKEGFSELRDARDSFGKLLESLVEGGEVKGHQGCGHQSRGTPCA